MKRLLVVTAALEIGAGLALLCLPSASARLLLGAPLDAPAAQTVARIGGAGLLALGVVCWFARGEAQSRATEGLVLAMTFYNVAAVAVLAYAGVELGLRGLALRPAVVLHVAMAVWCIVRFLGGPTQVSERAT